LPSSVAYQRYADQENESGNNGNPRPDPWPWRQDDVRWLVRRLVKRLGFNRRDEAVTAPRNRLDVSRTIRIVPESRPDLVDAEINAAIEVNKRVVSPDTLLNLRTADDFSRPLREHMQDNELLWLEFEKDTALSQLLRIWIQFEGSEVNPSVLFPGRAHANTFRPVYAHSTPRTATLLSTSYESSSPLTHC
jgi:hypothetical protein